jgi:hypothetical protein
VYTSTSLVVRFVLYQFSEEDRMMMDRVDLNSCLGDQLIAYQLELHHLFGITVSFLGYASLLIFFLVLIGELRLRRR